MLNAQPARTVQVLPRVSATLVLLVASLVPAALLAALTPDTWAAATRAGADAGSLLAALAVALAWLVVARLGVTAGAAVLAGLPGRVGQVGRRTASAWSPALARRLVRAALGVAVVSGPALSHAAAFADQGGYPILDRVITSPAAPGPNHPGPDSHRGRPPAPGTAHVVVVRPGDCLWAIAAAHLPPGRTAEQVAAAWPAWYDANRAVIGPDPGQLRPGMALVPPPVPR